ncbi:helix-turn-helix domain-containing protein [Ruegeria sp.]|uniref:GlxA family transcriptional regulator n=1 Tax=Ruegeria sp. TaxID=1879320 RepID=UPI00232594B2|nr:helix-turn-helix domain-containing protein [Ruegeria sp.]MDA7965812.1 helix-turn-helix domain-containing protein [Ruegeria sp.]
MENLDRKKIVIDVVLADGFSMLTTMLILEAFRFANLTLRRPAIDWRIRGIQSGAPKASNGFTLQSHSRFSDTETPADVVVLNASYFPDEAASPAFFAWLRAAHRQGSWLLALDTAPRLLAGAGLLDGRAATIHWEELDSVRALFPKAEFNGTDFEQSGRIFTCSGGMAVLDMALSFLAQLFDAQLARGVRQCFFLNEGRDLVAARNAKLSRAIEIMSAHIAAPLALGQIAKQAHFSERQMNRAFATEFDTTPGQFYTAMRLNKAQSLVLNTRFQIAEIGYTCGYATPSWFIKSYRTFFGITPNEERLRQEAGREQAQNRLVLFFQPNSTLSVGLSPQQPSLSPNVPVTSDQAKSKEP